MIWFNTAPLKYLEEDGLERTLQKCISRAPFLALYVLDKDLLIEAICWKLKEYFGVNLPLDEDTLSDQIGETVESMAKIVFVTKAEVDYFLNTGLYKEMMNMARRTENQSIVDGKKSSDWNIVKRRKHR